MSLRVKCFAAGPLGENTYIITDETTGLKAVVDPGWFGAGAISEIGEYTSLRYILLTHGHHDHFAAAQEYIDRYPQAVFAVPSGETYLLYGRRESAGRGNVICPEADLFLREGDTVSLGETVIRIAETPGHTEGGICYVTDRDVFTGDTLFRLSVGNTSFETGDWPALVRSIENKLYTLDGDITVWPGHGPQTNIGYEKKANPFV